MKKAQALLPFFAQQLISILIFIIVLVGLITLTKELTLATKEYDSQTFFYLSLRRLLSSADCLAYEGFGIRAENGKLIKSSMVYPGILDENKIKDYQYLNCMRLDNLNPLKDVKKGYWQIKDGSGYAHRYYVSIWWYNGSKVTGIFNPVAPYPSMVGYVNKREYKCTDYNFWDAESCEGKYGDPWDCIRSDGGGWSIVGLSCNGKSLPCRGEYTCAKGKDTRPLWNYTTSDEYCQYTLFGAREWIPSNFENLKQEIEFGEEMECEGSMSKTIPVFVYSNGKYFPGLVYFKSCILKGENYKEPSLEHIKIKTGGTSCE